MRRRSFLQFSVCSTLPFMLSGCVPPALLRHDGRKGPLGGSWAENARRAQALFAAAASGRFPDEIEPFAVTDVREAWLAAVEQYVRLPDPSFSEHVALATAGTDYFREVNRLFLPRSPAKRTAQSYKTNGALTIMPGESVAFRETGFCMDPSLPAPGKGEFLRLVPTSSLLPEALEPIYVATLTQASRADEVGATYRGSMQAIVWLFRTAGQTTSTAMLQPTHANAQYRQLIDAAYPGGWKKLVDYHQSALAGAQLASDLTNALSRKMRLPTRTSTADFLGQSISDRVVADHLQTLIRMPVTGQVVPGSQYTLLAPGVAAEVIGTAPLAASFHIINLSEIPFQFVPTAWAAESQRKTQRIAFPGGMLDFKAAIAELSGGVMQAERASALFQANLSNYNTDSNKKAFEKFLSLMNSEVAETILRRSIAPALKLTLDVAPLVGNCLSLYEAVSGKNWMTQEELSATDRAFALLGSVPGASVLGRLGPQAPKVVGAILKAASNSKALQAIDQVAPGALNSVKRLGSTVPGAVGRTLTSAGNNTLLKTIERVNNVDWATSGTVIKLAEKYQEDPAFQQTERAAEVAFRKFEYSPTSKR